MIAGKAPTIPAFIRDLYLQFTLGATNIVRYLRFLSCAIKVRDDGSTDISMSAYLTRVRTVHITRERK